MRQNFINVVLDQPNVEPGKQITGKVYVGVYRKENANVQVEIQGMEMCKFIYHTTEYYYVDKPVGRGVAPKRHGAGARPSHGRPAHGRPRTRRVRKSRRVAHKAQNSYKIFYNKQDLTPGYLGPGEYCFPFTFTVPSSAPSSFEWKQSEDYQAKITYGVKASYGSSSDLEEMVVQQHIPEKYSSSHISHSQAVNCCCCIGKGTVGISTTFENDNYRPGEMVNVKTSVDNTKGEVSLKSVDAVAYCYIILYAKGKSYKKQVQCGKVSAQGIEEGQGSAGMIPMQFQLNVSPKMPTVMGRIVRAEFILKVETPVSGCCICSKTPQTALPIVVHTTPKPPKQFVPPPSFAPKPMKPKAFNLVEEPNPPPMQYNPGTMYNPARPVVVQPVIIQQVPVVAQPVMMQPMMGGQPMMQQGQQIQQMPQQGMMPQQQMMPQPGMQQGMMPQHQMMPQQQMMPQPGMQQGMMPQQQMMQQPGMVQQGMMQQPRMG